MNENTSVTICLVFGLFVIAVSLKGCQELLLKEECLNVTKSAECMK